MPRSLCDKTTTIACDNGKPFKNLEPINPGFSRNGFQIISQMKKQPIWHTNGEAGFTKQTGIS
jgi:hypothetical protein